MADFVHGQGLGNGRTLVDGQEEKEKLKLKAEELERRNAELTVALIDGQEEKEKLKLKIEKLERRNAELSLLPAQFAWTHLAVLSGGLLRRGAHMAYAALCTHAFALTAVAGCLNGAVKTKSLFILFAAVAYCVGIVAAILLILSLLFLKILVITIQFEDKIETLASQKDFAAIVSGMKLHAKNADIQEKVCRSLEVFAVNADNNVLIAKAGGIPRLLAALDNHA